MTPVPPLVAAELIRLLYRHFPAVVAANIVNSSLVVAALWHDANRFVLLAWAAAVIALAAGRVSLWRAFRNRFDISETARWGFLSTMGAMVSGLLWGSSAFLFVHSSHSISLIVISFVIGGMGAGSVTGLSAHLPAFYLYLLCSMLPFELRLILLGDRVGLAMSVMAAIYVIGLVAIGRNFNAALVQALVLNEEKKALLATREEEVAQRTADLQAANAELEREIEERKRVEIKLDEARAAAESANQAKSRFLAAASHDLRQPLQSMFLFASALHRYVRDGKGIDALARIERGLDLLKGMLDSMLDLSRLDVNVTKPTFAAFPLRPMLDDIVAAYHRIAVCKGVELKRGDLAGCLVLSDETLLGRMVRNLVENAIRYTEHGQIVLSTRSFGDTVRIEIADTGIGIPPDQLERIFEEFHQVGNPERDKARGLGLGLSIVQRLSMVLDHPVTVRSQLGEGSAFSIDVPVAEGAETVIEPASDRALDRGEGRQIVVVDDDPMVLLALGTTFEQWGYTVTMAGSEDEAVAQLAPGDAPHLIVADYRLRNGRVGTAAIRAIRARFGAEIPGIVLTGETGAEFAADAESLKALVLHKPVTPNDLAFALRRLVGPNGTESHSGSTLS